MPTGNPCTHAQSLTHQHNAEDGNSARQACSVIDEHITRADAELSCEQNIQDEGCRQAGSSVAVAEQEQQHGTHVGRSGRSSSRSSMGRSRDAADGGAAAGHGHGTRFPGSGGGLSLGSHSQPPIFGKARLVNRKPYQPVISFSLHLVCHCSGSLPSGDIFWDWLAT